MHAEAYGYVASAIPRLSPRRRIVEFGGRDMNGSVRPLFTSADSYVSIDLAPGAGVDWVGDALEYRPANPIDTVVCCEVLEHAPAWRSLLQHAHGMLPTGGVLLVTCATSPREPHSGRDGGDLQDDEYYGNVDPDAFGAVMRALGWVECRTTVAARGDLYCWARK